MASFTGVLRSKPQLVDGAILVAVLLHLALFLVIPNFRFFLRPLASPDKGDWVHDLYLGLLGPASIIAGLAGVVITFALSSMSERFKVLRAQGGKALQRTWISSSLSALLAALAGIIASMLLISGQAELATFFFEAALLWLAHGAIRLLWILYKLIGVQRIDDLVEADSNSGFKHSEFPVGRGAGARDQSSQRGI